MNKKQRHEAIQRRAEAALADMYHNATPTYPLIDDEKESAKFDYWFQWVAEVEIEYINDGGAYGRNYVLTLQAPCNSGRITSDAARRVYIRKEMREMHLDRAKYAPWERISEYGPLYTYGRGGRTLAPEGLMARYGSSDHVNRHAYEDMNIGDTVELIRIVESFNEHVRAWCAGVPDMWREHVAEELDESAYKHVRGVN